MVERKVFPGEMDAKLIAVAAPRWRWIAALLIVITPLRATQGSTPGDRSITYCGQHFDLYKTAQIDNGIYNGLAAYYSADSKHPDSATDTIVISRVNPRDVQGRTETPARYARAMLAQVKGRGGTIIMPLAIPDTAHRGHYTFYATFYYIYPNRGLGDIFLSRIFLGNSGVVGILYRHTIKTADPTTIGADARRWMMLNLKSYGTALRSLALPAKPSESSRTP